MVDFVQHGILLIPGGTLPPGKRVAKWLGVVEEDRSHLAKSNIMEDLQEVKADLRQKALSNLAEKAQELGANAVVELTTGEDGSTDSSSSIQYAMFITVRGIAVVLEGEEDR